MKNKAILGVPGTQDLIGPELSKRLKIKKVFSETVSKFNIKPVQTSILEKQETFVKNLGETSDVVQKEMFTLDDLVLRPEGTAGLIRAIISNGWVEQLPLKVAYQGSMFRKERPQKGRFREFEQLGVEFVGYEGLLGDIECLMVAESLLSSLRIRDKVSLKINFLASPEERKEYRNILVKYLSENIDSLSKESKGRLEKNPLRVLDSKQSEDQWIVKKAPKIEVVYTKESSSYFNQVQESLRKLEVSFEVDPTLVRGLDYYTGLVFEYVSKDNSGAQNTVLAGGRFDGLMEQMGGPKCKSIGFAAGLERLSYLVESEEYKPTELVGIVVTDNEYLPEAFKLAKELRSRNFVVEIPENESISKKMKKLNKLNSNFVVFIGEEEIKTSTYTLKNMDTRSQEKLVLNALILKLLVKRL